MSELSLKEIEDKIVDVPDFPSKGIVFKDISPILLDVKFFNALVEQLEKTIREPIDKLAVIESRGFLLGAPLAEKLNAGLVLIRKKGKLPRKTLQESYSLEYGEDVIEVHEEDLSQGDRVMIIDDVLATGGTASAAERLCQKAGATVVGSRFMIELKFLGGAEKLSAPSQSLFAY